MRTTAAVALVLLVGLGATIAFLLTEVCDKHVAQEATTLSCRHLQITDPPILAGVVLLMLALAVLVDLNEVAFLGVSMKRNLQDARAAADSAARAQAGAEGSERNAAEAARSARDAEGKALQAFRSATEAAEHARGAQRSASQTEDLVRRLQSIRAGGRATEHTDVEGQVRTLADQYNAIRMKPRSDARTAEMTGVVAEMITLFSVAGGAGAAASWLRSEDRGMRLAAYACLHTAPDDALTDPLAHAALEEDKPFGQYWGLRALRRNLELGGRLDRNLRRELERLLAQIGPSTDRGYEIGEILRLTRG